jgi:hypothetical protein
VADTQHVPHVATTLYLSVLAMNYIETEINDLISYLCCDKFRVDTRVQAGDVLRALLPIRNIVTYLAAILSKLTINSKNMIGQTQNKNANAFSN